MELSPEKIKSVGVNYQGLGRGFCRLGDRVFSEETAL